VTQSPNTGESTAAAASAGGARRWLDPHRKRFWAVVLLALYTLAGFFLVPMLVKSLIISTVQDDLGREASVERVRFNPYVLSLEISGFGLNDPDGVTQAGFDRFFVNMQLSSLFRWAWTFREISLEGFDLLLERYAVGDSRLSRLLAEQAARAAPEESPPEDSGGLPRLLVHDLALKNGRIRLRDVVPIDPVDLEFGPIDVSVQELNTLPDRSGQQAVNVRLPGGATLSWNGSIELAPLKSEGTVVVEGSHLDQAVAYLKAVLPLQKMQATLSLQTQYRVSELEDGGLVVELDGLNLDLSDFAMTGLEPTTEFVTFPSLQLSGGTLRYPDNTVNFSSIRLSEPQFSTWLDASGQLSLLQLVSADPAPDNGAPEAAGSDSEDWRVGVDELAIENGRVSFSDRSIEPQALLAVRDLAVTLRQVSNEAGAQIPVSLAGSLESGGQFGFDGQISALPDVSASGTATASAIALTLAQPYAQQMVNILINEGTLDTAFELTLDPDGNITAGGELAVAGLRVDDTVEGKPLVGWNQLEIDRFEADTASSKLGLSLVTFDQPFGRLVIREDLSTNLSGLMITAEDAATADQPVNDDAPPYAVVVGGIAVNDGSMDFSDLSLPLPFATYIRKLEGTISTVDTASSSPSNIRLEGQVDEYGLARIEGAMDLLDPVRSTDVTMEFRNLLMSNLSPYTVQFAGREIDEGKLNLDLGYRIENGQLQGQNAIVMSDLVLGDEVDSPDAVSLPLGLAVALLTDANGVIDIDLPVSGDINDPEFKIGGVIWKAFAGLITKIVAAPFRLLGSLIGIESEDLGQFQFLAGRADLTPPELEKVSQLQQALRQRPELTIEVSGPFDPAADVPALQFQKLKSIVLERLGVDYANPDEEFRMLNEEIRVVFETLFVERFQDTPLDVVKADHMAPPADNPEGKPVLDQTAYAADLRDRLLASETVGQQDLEALANMRAEAIRDAFLADGDFDAARIAIAAPSATESEDSEWVVMELGVVAE
jgi:hypothetical protein